jgi:hypothetical protein
MMKAKIVYDENHQPVEAIIPYETYVLWQQQEIDPIGLTPTPWSDEELARIREIMARLPVSGFSEAIMAEREERR